MNFCQTVSPFGAFKNWAMLLPEFHLQSYLFFFFKKITRQLKKKIKILKISSFYLIPPFPIPRWRCVRWAFMPPGLVCSCKFLIDPVTLETTAIMMMPMIFMVMVTMTLIRNQGFPEMESSSQFTAADFVRSVNKKVFFPSPSSSSS